MKVLKKLFVLLAAVAALAFGLLLLAQEGKDERYIHIYGDED